MAEASRFDLQGNLAPVVDLVREPDGPSASELIDRAIDQCLVTMVYQPIVDLKSGAVFAYEALCRSRLPQFDGPEALIQAATEAGRIGELGRLQRRLASRNCADYPIFMNISPHEFDDVYLVRPDDAIFSHRHPVYVEITESVPLTFFDQCHSVLAELRRKGARLAIDDLGAGYSNLKYIADLAPDIVKLDRELVAGCTRRGAQYKLLRSIAQLCREVNAKVVAEGVETAEELDAVTSAGIELCQGYFLGRPKSPPPEVCWPAVDLLTTRSEIAEMVDQRRSQRPTAATEEDERRIAEMEELSCVLEKSVRKARGEVVRLRKALARAETESEQARARLAAIEGSLQHSESERLRLARMVDRSVEVAPFVKPEPAPGQRWNPRRVALHAGLWAAGLLAGLALYFFDPRIEELPRGLERVPVASLAAATGEPASRLAPGARSAAGLTATDTTLENVERAVRAWAAAWSARDVDTYLASYATAFGSETENAGVDWRAERREELLAAEYVQIEMDELSITLEDPDTAVATFVQISRSDGHGDQVRKRLELLREEGTWRILREELDG